MTFGALQQATALMKCISLGLTGTEDVRSHCLLKFRPEEKQPQAL